MEQNNQLTRSQKKSLFVYYSLEGNTKDIVKEALKVLKCDVLELRPEKPVPQKGFRKYLEGGGQVKTGQKPALKPISLDLEDYSTIYIAAPVWAGKMASPMYSFLETYPVKDKIKAALFTSKSGMAKGAIKQIESMVKEPIPTASLYDLSMKKASLNNALLIEWLRKVLHDQKISEKAIQEKECGYHPKRKEG